MDPQVKALLEQLTKQLGEVPQIKAAVEQMEAELKAVPATIEQRIAQMRRDAWDANGRYRGIFDSEQQARGFGLLVLGKCGGNANALAQLKKDYPTAYERAMASDPNASGGALIAPEFSTRILSLMERYGVFDAHAFHMPMQGDSLTFLREVGDPTVFLVNENTAGSDSSPQYSNVGLTAKEWGTLTYYPKSLGEDSAAQIGELVGRAIARAFALKLDNVGFNGDGTSTYFGITGVRQKLVDINGVDDGGGLVLGSGNAWAELTLADHEKVAGALPEYAAGEAAWYCSRAYFWTVMAKLALAAGGVTAEEIQGRRTLTFLGYPVKITQVMPKTEANSQVPALLGDLSQAATVGDRRILTIDQSGEYKFAERQVTVLGTRRVAVSVHDLGDATTAGPVVGLITASS